MLTKFLTEHRTLMHWLLGFGEVVSIVMLGFSFWALAQRYSGDTLQIGQNDPGPATLTSILFILTGTGFFVVINAIKVHENRLLQLNGA